MPGMHSRLYKKKRKAWFGMKFRGVKSKLTAGLLVMAEVAAILYTGALPAEAKSASLTQEEAREIVSTYSISDEIPGYKEYLAEHQDADSPAETIEVLAADYDCYAEKDKETVYGQP